jgi:signal peptidase I
MSLQRAAALTAIAGLAAALSGLRRVEVRGRSMAPALLPGDRLLVLRLARPRAGHVVALRDPRDSRRAMVKRVAAAPGEAVTCAGAVLRAGRGWVVLGDNLAESTDSRSFGAVPRRLLLGRCAYRYAPEHRRGRVSRRG